MNVPLRQSCAVAAMLGLATLASGQVRRLETPAQARPIGAQACEVCKAEKKVNELLQKATIETKLIPQGLVTVTHVPDGIQRALAEASKELDSAVKKFKNAERIAICDDCKTMFKEADLEKAKVQQYSTDSFVVLLITADVPAAVNTIQNFAKSNSYAFNGDCLVSRNAVCGCGPGK